ncbi:MAG TPA: glycosyltransferase [Terracidiphilus sp.]|nr:glycosyltransferase [Terracidiphilus sp.]
MQDLHEITPVILTFNEEENIARTLRSLSWAPRVVIVDSGSSDATKPIAQSFKNVDWHVRAFDRHALQWEFAIKKTGISSRYVLALDADMQTSSEFVREAQETFLPGGADGGVLSFQHWVLGGPMSSTLCPPQLRLFPTNSVCVRQAAHTQDFSLPSTSAPPYRFRSRVIHDDRKPLERFVRNQLAYSQLEFDRISGQAHHSLKDRLRRAALMPLLVPAAAYVLAGGPLAHSRSLCYALERLTYETLLAMRILRARSGVDDLKETSI